MTDELLIVVDIGNTNTVLGVFRGDELIHRFRLSSDAERTADEYAALVLPLLGRVGLELPEAGAVVISSVVPPLNPTFTRLSEEYLRRRPLFVEPGVRTGLPIRYDSPAEVGADRIVNSLAAREIYGAPVVVVDFGTATTFDVVNGAGEYAGGIIAPGVMISAEALFAHAARLFEVDLRRPEQLIGRNTAGALQSGLYWGCIGLVDGILERLIGELGSVRRVVATGGDAPLIGEGSKYIEEISPDLTLLGLKLIHERNR